MTRNTGPPRPEDFTESNTHKHVLKEKALEPSTLIPFLVGLVVLLWVVLFEAPFFLTMFGLGALVVAGSWFYFNGIVRFDKHAMKFHELLHDKFEAHVKTQIRNLRDELTDVNEQRGVLQLDQLQNKFENVRVVLNRRFQQGELTFSRYLGTVETVFKSVLDGLEIVYTILRNLSDINPDELRKRIKREKLDEGHPVVERLRLYDDDMRQVEQLLRGNEEALTGIDRIGSELAKITTTARSKLTLEEAMADLKRLAERAEVYSTRPKIRNTEGSDAYTTENDGSSKRKRRRATA